MSGTLGDGRAGTDVKPEQPVLERFDLARRKLDVIADPVSAYAVSGDGTRLVVRDGSTLRVLRTDRSGASAPTDGPVDAGADEYPIDTRRVVVTVDPTAEWRQMFDEAARLMRDHFWVADMAGIDWAAEVARYRPLVDAVGSHDDLVDLLWELHGELGTSHAYVMACTAARPRRAARAARRRPGAHRGRVAGRAGAAAGDVRPRRAQPAVQPGRRRPGGRRDRRGRRAAGRPAARARAAAGRAGGGAGRAHRAQRADGTEVRRVVVRPLRSEAALRYQDWVAGRRAAVVERSGGRLGYLHVPDMMPTGWAQLHRDLSRETSREGLVLDVRGNAGGHTSQLIVEKLARRVIGWDVVRHRQPMTYPMDAPRGPIVALADEFSGSDGDIVTAAIKRLGLGPVVGTRTWGGVIGIDGRYGLVDGTRVTQPRYAFWFDDVAWDVENHGVDPDVEVVVAPEDWAAGRDPQLERAVDLALEALAARPAVTPPDPATRPSRARPALPPRG